MKFRFSFRRLRPSIQVIDNKLNPSMKHVFTTRDGVEFFTYANPLEIPAIRGIAAETAKRFMNMNLTKETLTDLLRAHRDAAMKNDIQTCFAIVSEMEMRMKLICEEKSMLDFVNIYILMRDEDPQRPSEYHRKRKFEIAERDDQARCFFLQWGWSLAEKFSNKPASDLLAYLEETRPIAARLKSYLPETTPDSSSVT